MGLKCICSLAAYQTKNTIFLLYLYILLHRYIVFFCSLDCVTCSFHPSHRSNDVFIINRKMFNVIVSDMLKHIHSPKTHREKIWEKENEKQKKCIHIILIPSISNVFVSNYGIKYLADRYRRDFFFKVISFALTIAVEKGEISAELFNGF